MTQNVCGKGSIPGTCEANCQKLLGADKEIKRGKAPRTASPKFGEVPVGRRGCTILQGTYEANCQKVPGKNEIIHKRVLSLGRAPQRGERAKSIRRIDDFCLFLIEVPSCQFPFLPPQSAPQPAPPRGSLTNRRPSAV